MPNSEPLLSVGIALYRSEFLESLFNVLLKQTYKNVEYVISIDSPKDEKIQALVESFKKRHGNVKVYNQYPALGPSINAKFVFNKSNGDYFIRLDDDDSFKSNTHLEQLVSTLNEGYDYAFPDTEVEHWEHGKCVSIRKNTMKCYEGCCSKYDFTMASLSETAMLFYAMYRSNKLRETFGYYEQLCDRKHHIEGVFVHKVASSLRGCYVPSEALIYRIHGKNVSRTHDVQEFIDDYKVYFGRSLKLFHSMNDISLSQKLQIYMKFVPKSSRYLISLYKSKVKQRTRSAIFHILKAVN